MEENTIAEAEDDDEVGTISVDELKDIIRDIMADVMGGEGEEEAGEEEMEAGEEEMEVLLNSNTMPTLLPSTAFFLRLKQPPAREMIQAGLPVALASDYNPGSSPSGRMQFILSLACVNLRMLPEEAINAATINSAYAMNVQQDLGSITKGKKANLFVSHEIPSIAFLPYAFGTQLVYKVMLNGRWL